MKKIVFCFCGGVRDGESVRSDQPRGTLNEANLLWKLTWEGTIGRRFDVTEPTNQACNRYQVKSKNEVGDEVRISCEHVT